MIFTCFCGTTFTGARENEQNEREEPDQDV